MSVPTQAGPAATGGLRARLEAKTRRRTTVHVAVTDPGPDAARVASLRQLVAAAGTLLERSEDDQARDRADLAVAETALAGCYADVELLALPSADLEALVAAYPGDDDAVGDDAGMAWREALPVFLAECATDPELRDAVWWQDVLAGEAWTHGELLALWRQVLQLNVRAPSGRHPKG